MDTFEIFKTFVVIASIILIIWFYVVKNPKEVMHYKAKKQAQTCKLIMKEISPKLNNLLLPAPAYFRPFAIEILKNMILKDVNLQASILYGLGGIHSTPSKNPTTTITLPLLLLGVYKKFIEIYPTKKNDFCDFLHNIQKETQNDTIVSTIVPKEYLPDNF